MGKTYRERLIDVIDEEQIRVDLKRSTGCWADKFVLNCLKTDLRRHDSPIFHSVDTKVAFANKMLGKGGAVNTLLASSMYEKAIKELEGVGMDEVAYALATDVEGIGGGRRGGIYR